MKSNTSAQLRLKVALLVTLLIPLNAAFQMQPGLAHMSMISLLYNAVTILFVLVAFSRLIEKFLPKLALSRAELLSLYVAVSLSTAIGGHMCVQILISVISYAFAFATPENDWQALFWNYIPEWLSVRDKGALDNLYRWDSTLYLAPHIRAWSPPMLVWGCFLFALFSVMLAINFILRKQWTENERLSYPLIQLPLEMTSRRRSFFGSKAMWIGFGVAAFIDLLNGFNHLFPQIPRIGLTRSRENDLADLFTIHPWDAIGWLPVGIYPFAVGLAFFIPLDLSFSVWVFYLYWKLQRVLGSAFALPHGFPYASEQSFGAYAGIGVMGLWAARRHLVQVARKCLGVSSRVDDTDEPLSYRGTVIWLLASLVFLFAFCHRAGMSFWVIALFFGLYYMLAIGITRVRAELGSPVHDQHFAGADEMTYAFAGAKPLGTSNMTMLSYFYFFNRAYDCLLMPHQLEGLKIAERADIQYRRFGGVMVFATVLGIAASIWGYLHFAYQGEINTGWAGEEAFQRLEGWLAHPSETNASVITAIGVGFLVSVALTLMRGQFLWMPLHAAGYAVTTTWTMNFFWFSIFVSFVLKWLIVKHGGLRSFRKAAPFFLGLVLGEFVVTTFWGVFGIVTGQSTYITIDM